MMNRLIILLIFSLGSVALTGQTKKAYVEAAEDAAFEKDHYSSLAFYLEALDFDSSDIDVIYNVAESARQFSSYRVAFDNYEKVLAADNENKYPLTAYYAGKMSQAQGNYEAAKRYYELYLSEQEGQNDYYTARANKEIESCDWAIGIASVPDANLSIYTLGDEVNTEFSEFGATEDGDGITYSSLRFDPKERGFKPTDMISKIMNSEETLDIADGKWSAVNKQNLHTAHTAYNFNKSRVYYTICEYINKTDIRCDLYSRTILGDGTFGPESKLPDHVNTEGNTTTQPNIGFDKELGQEVLYFVSDRDGGEGKLDIWRSALTGVDQFSDPVNVEAINTAENDITPFFHTNSQVLYFSSDGYTSLGGYDVYQSAKENSLLGTPKNMGAPTNSSFNDVYYTLNETADEGYLSSNRTGSKYVDELTEACCYDVYKFEVGELEINLNALTFDSKSLDSLSGATVTIVDALTGTTIGTITNGGGPDHNFALEKGKNYLIITSKDGYRTDTSTLSTIGMFRSEDITRKIYLQRTSIDLQVLTFDEISKEALPGTTVTLYDLTDPSKAPVVMTNQSGNDTYFDVVPDHKYRLVGSRSQYYDDEIEFTATVDDGSDMITQRLYLNRRDLDFYLPLALYFDNDEPEKRSTRLTTNMNYSETFDNYIVREFEFIDKYTESITDDSYELAEKRVQDFFNDEVRTGFDRFERFLAGMLSQLESGKRFELSIRGFASPRADSRYNLALSQRRVQSVQNELRIYLSGALVPYIQNGQLKITELSYGENLAPDDVSDALFDRRNSVYSPEASKERRVEIVEIKSTILGN